MIFVELTPFIAFRVAHWTDDELRELQNHLLDNPSAGDVIRASGGLRKLRWLASGRGSVAVPGLFITTTCRQITFT
jgi:hypothetical protein